jgi:hypothetical protein
MVVTDANATGDAVLRGDLDEASFRVSLLAFKVGALGLVGLLAAAEVLEVELGPLGGPPGLGYGAYLMRVADELLEVALAPDLHVRVGFLGECPTPVAS